MVLDEWLKFRSRSPQPKLPSGAPNVSVFVWKLSSGSGQKKRKERLKETRGRIAEAHKEIGALRYHADEEERQLGDLRALVAKAEKASEKRTRLKKSLAAKIEAVKPNGNGSPN
jgi:hypothetical protein